MKTIIEFLIRKFLRGYHLARNPKKGRKNKVKAVCFEQTEDKGEASNG